MVPGSLTSAPAPNQLPQWFTKCREASPALAVGPRAPGRSPRTRIRDEAWRCFRDRR